MAILHAQDRTSTSYPHPPSSLIPSTSRPVVTAAVRTMSNLRMGLDGEGQGRGLEVGVWVVFKFWGLPNRTGDGAHLKNAGAMAPDPNGSCLASALPSLPTKFTMNFRRRRKKIRLRGKWERLVERGRGVKIAEMGGRPGGREEDEKNERGEGGGRQSCLKGARGERREEVEGLTPATACKRGTSAPRQTWERNKASTEAISSIQTCPLSC
ncbi:hypothetical protein BDK51DRAFT_32740 [Blyttiomyces helicus]|uniref:Uncharacterized protein n=1 Tax=Blyttiomyces helicus TaxID=388810 RepID=A0A4P9VYJ5_9FUNG|nr:hypothetical protein BDK51DRAFT_32740 [Blyttiomyces helicus]|eukprot:RKO84859.1 hypothetical protein BDK51DRAFT_32740 [Blyttiomyces helicus]